MDEPARVLRPWWKRLVLGQPYIGFEFVGRPEEIEVAGVDPDGVPKGLVERAVEVAFPGARTENADTDSIRELPSSGGSLS